MSLYKLPQGVSNELLQIIRKFWWKTGDGKGMSWISWKNICKRKDEGGLGFKDLRIFNQALLAKQCWRLLKFPDSLAAKVLHAKYYPKCDFLKARRGASSSFLWQSLLHGRELVCQGLRWRIGDGRKVKVFDDPWLPTPPFKPISRPIFLQESILVSDFIQDGKWRKDIIGAVFQARDQDLILSIPLNLTGGSDRLMWHFTPSGNFTVSSAYTAGYHMQQYKEQTASGSSPMSAWNLIWDLSILPKVQHFIWRLCKNTLPCKMHLNLRGITNDRVCPRCGNVDETDTHVFFECPYAKLVWKMLQIPPNIIYMKASSWLDFLHLVAEHELISTGILTTMAITLWAIWGSRNEFIFQGKEVPAEVVAHRGSTFLQHYHSIMDTQPPQKKDGVASRKTWLPPTEGLQKLNVDAAFKDGKAAYGFVLRDAQGKLCMAGAGPLHNMSSIAHAELLAMWRSLEILHQRNQRVDCGI